MKPILFVLFMGLGLLRISSACAQSELEARWKHIREKQVKSEFDLLQPPRQLLRYGRFYRHTYPDVQGTHYFGDQFLHQGQLRYEGMDFDSLRLGYDLLNDLVIISLYHDLTPEPLILNQAWISEFNLSGHTFRRVRDREIPGLPEGIYEIAFVGQKLRLWVRRRLEVEKFSKAIPGEKRYHFVKNDQYYLEVGGRTNRIASKKDLLEALEADEEIASFIKRNRMLIAARRADFQQQLIRVLRYADAKENNP